MPFTSCISKINNTQIDDAEYIDIVMPMYNLIEYNDNYSKTSGSLWQFCKDIPAVDNNDAIIAFNGANATDSFNFKRKITSQTAADNNNGNIAGRVDVEIMVSLKYLSNFWRTLEMPLINCEVELILNWSANCIIIYQLKSGFKRYISWNKYLVKPELLARNTSLNHLIEPGFRL